jgi:hypothetical protein
MVTTMMLRVVMKVVMAVVNVLLLLWRSCSSDSGDAMSRTRYHDIYTDTYSPTPSGQTINRSHKREKDFQRVRVKDTIKNNGSEVPAAYNEN